MAKLNNIILHCSASYWGCAADIRKWHIERGWRDIGYHYVICNGMTKPGYFVNSMDGSIEAGRYLDGDGFITAREQGAHALGYNDNSIGVCMIGKDKFTPRQFGSLFCLLSELASVHHIDKKSILGHYETGQAHGKTCPNIIMNNIRGIVSKTLQRSTA